MSRKKIPVTYVAGFGEEREEVSGEEADARAWAGSTVIGAPDFELMPKRLDGAYQDVRPF